MFVISCFWRLDGLVMVFTAQLTSAWLLLNEVEADRSSDRWLRRPHDAFEYLFSEEETLTRQEAEEKCRKLNSALINFEENINGLYKYIRNQSKSGYQSREETFHFGLIKCSNNPDFIWTLSNLALDPTVNSLAVGLYDNISLEAQVCAYSDLQGQWFSEDCRSPIKRGYVCQRRKTAHFTCSDLPCLNQGTCVPVQNALHEHTLGQILNNAPGQETITPTSVGIHGKPKPSTGSVVEGKASYRCVCPGGVSGEHCQNDVQECSTNPCRNNGTCIEKFGYYVCLCTEDFVGKNCQFHQRKIHKVQSNAFVEMKRPTAPAGARRVDDEDDVVPADERRVGDEDDVILHRNNCSELEVWRRMTVTMTFVCTGMAAVTLAACFKLMSDRTRRHQATAKWKNMKQMEANHLMT